MDARTEYRSPTAPADPPRGLIRWLYCNNPFYVLSASLVFFGLRASFHPSGHAFEVWGLFSGLAGYTLLLAGTACLLIRLGDVWDDVRTLMLLVVLMFLAVSVLFDDTMICHPRLGKACYVGGLLFSALVSEGMLRGVRLRLPALFRVPYYLFLALFFLFPVVLAPILTSPSNPMAVSDPRLPWALFAFSPLAGLVTLSLLPAARRGASYVRDNGSPWPWPLYPWSLFVIIAVGVCARAYYACISLHPVERSGTIFGPYFLVPFLLAVNVVLLEIGLSTRRGAMTRGAALLAPAILVLLAATGHRNDPVYQDFLHTFMTALGGSPLYLTLIATGVFFGYARLRGIPAGVDGLAVALGALAVVGPNTIELDGLVSPQPLPLLMLAALQLVRALRRRDSLRAALAATCVVAAATVALPPTVSHTMRIAVAFHLSLAAALAIGALFDDLLSELLSRAALVVALCVSWYAMRAAPTWFADVPPSILALYPPLMALITAAYGLLIRDRGAYWIAGANAAGWVTAFGWRGYLQLRLLFAGLDQIAWGLASFLVAAAISLWKAGVLQKWIDRQAALPGRSRQ